MTRDSLFGRGLAVGAAGAVLLAFVIVPRFLDGLRAVPVPGAAGSAPLSEASSPAGSAASVGDRAETVVPAAETDGAAVPGEFRDPFYGFLVGIAESDSLGSWTRDELLARFALPERSSRLPLERIVQLERQPNPEASELRRAGRRPQRIWRIALDGRLDYPMPYHILGHSLGSLDISRELVFSEWWLGDCTVYAPENGTVAGVPVESLTAFRIEEGWIVMDVDALVDRLLGRRLDDCWTQGFAICRSGGRIHGLAVSCNRDLKPICGEIDFATNEIIPRGRPLARGVAVYVRPWLLPGETDPRAWRFGDAEREASWGFEPRPAAARGSPLPPLVPPARRSEPSQQLASLGW
jgi:hypothetical protein